MPPPLDGVRQPGAGHQLNSRESQAEMVQRAQFAGIYPLLGFRNRRIEAVAESGHENDVGAAGGGDHGLALAHAHG